MKKIILSLHTTLDGFVAGPNGEMDWIKFDDDLFELVGGFTANADTAIYGRITYEMMNSYWPNAGELPNATKHDREHSAWYNRVDKIVFSKSMEGIETDKTKLIGSNLQEEIKNLKMQEGKNVLIFGSPTAAHFLMEHNLIDEYWLFVNPILLGHGIPLFANIKHKTELKLQTSMVLPCEVVALHYKAH